MGEVTLHPEKWVDRYADYLFNYTIVRVNDRIVAEDLISETFLAGLKSKDNFKGNASERTWLISILKRKIIDYYRKKNTQKAQAEVHITYSDDEMEGDWLEERVEDFSDQTAEDTLENKELRLAIFECLDTLDERHADIFKLKTIQNYDTEAICNEYNITPSNLWVIIHRARKALMTCLKKHWLE
ncbi:sigma-70 family RNA polymerase sigma factor [Luteirhabdus pelagi]|uniref:sigma-70 family RNA polymerase sigma factor n=1 Tax=Luteirhabdus pelagi TaxID=2792783 RepID=UPI00193AA328|nr:sigma-70 family RNA polymerase sigma factor [Luteirhabdus pelagi]MCT8338739.1 sigma-70 family RNA polymerase sigma factor [Thermobacterium salinum]